MSWAILTGMTAAGWLTLLVLANERKSQVERIDAEAAATEKARNAAEALIESEKKKLAPKGK